MYSSLENIFKHLEASDGEAIKLDQKDKRVTIAVLLYIVILADGKIRKEELSSYRNILDTYLHVVEDEFDMFEELVKRKLNCKESLELVLQEIKLIPESEKHEVLDMMKDISLSDNHFHEVELNLVTKTAKLLDLN